MNRSEAESLIADYWAAGIALVQADNKRLLPEFDPIRVRFRDARDRLLMALEAE